MKEAEDLKIMIRGLEDFALSHEKLDKTPANDLAETKLQTTDEKLDETPADDSAETKLQTTDNTSAIPKYPISDVEPKKPRKSPPTNFSVLRFDAGGEVHCFG